MDIGEVVTKSAVPALEKEKDPACSGEDKDPEWTSHVNKFNSQGDPCTGTQLYKNMHSVASAHEKKGLGFVPPKREGTPWTLALVTETFFPIQAHHLIPKSYLPTHRVCTWLAIKYKNNDMYELRYDSKYDTDHHNNGYCMPYATPLAEWGGDQSNKTATAFLVMEQTKIQLHQGSHAKALDPDKLAKLAGQRIIPDITETSGSGESDEYEEAGIHEPGYLLKVGRLLSVVDGKSQRHASKCTECQKVQEGGKTKVLPTEGVVELMNRVSAILKILIDGNVAHVSGYAYFYAFTKGQVFIKDNAVHVHGGKEDWDQRLS